MSVQAELEGFKPQHDVVLVTERLYLRAVRPSDIHNIHRLRQNAAVMEYMTTGVETEDDPYACHSAQRIRMMMDPKLFSFAVQEKAAPGGDQESQTVIGFLGCFRTPEIGYIFDEPYWGKGYATEGVAAFVKKYWTQFPNGLSVMQPEERNILIAYIFEGNDASQNVLRKVGFTFVRKELIEREKGPVMDVLLQIERPEKVAIPASATGLPA